MPTTLLLAPPPSNFQTFRHPWDLNKWLCFSWGTLTDRIGFSTDPNWLRWSDRPTQLSQFLCTLHNGLKLTICSKWLLNLDSCNGSFYSEGNTAFVNGLALKSDNYISHWDFELFSSSNHISPLLNRPQGCQGCQKNQKCLRITTMIRFAANFQPKLNEFA